MVERNPDSSWLLVSLRRLPLVYLRSWWGILLCAVLASAALYSYTRLTVTPLYRASVSVYVNNMKDTEGVTAITTGTLSAGQQLVNIYVNIIRSDRVLTRVAEELSSEGLNAAALRSMVTATPSSTGMFSINVNHPDPEQAVKIANTVANVAPAEIADIVEGSSARVIDYAVRGVYYSPNYRRKAIQGALLGAALAASIVTARFLLDVRIKDEEDLAQICGLPVLGQIPSYTEAGGRKREGYTASGGSQ